MTTPGQPVLTGVTPAGLVPIPTRKEYKARDGTVADKLRYDVLGFGENEVRKFMIELAGDETAQQIAIDNPPAFVNTDNIRGRSIAFARRRITVSFGVRLQMAALAVVTRALKGAIEKSTNKHTGKLADMANWQWRYVRDGRAQPLPVGGASGIPMGPRDFLVLVPRGVINARGQAYATAANMRVAGGGRLSFRRTANGRVAKKNQAIGFLALASRVAQTSPLFQGFTVNAGFSIKHALPNEVVRLGGVRTGFIKIRPKVGR